MMAQNGGNKLLCIWEVFFSLLGRCSDYHCTILAILSRNIPSWVEVGDRHANDKPSMVTPVFGGQLLFTTHLHTMSNMGTMQH